MSLQQRFKAVNAITAAMLLLLVTALFGTAEAFRMVATNDSPLFNNDTLLRIIDEESNRTGWNVPNDPKVRVHLQTSAKWADNLGTYIYRHHIALERSVTGIKAPYAGDYWMIIRHSNSWGTGPMQHQESTLRSMTREFFQDLLLNQPP